MKTLPRVRAAHAVLLAAGLLGLATHATAQTGAVLSARPGERPPRALPEAASPLVTVPNMLGGTAR